MITKQAHRLHDYVVDDLLEIAESSNLCPYPSLIKLEANKRKSGVAQPRLEERRCQYLTNMEDSKSKVRSEQLR